METAVAEAPPKREPKLNTLTKVENVVNEYAQIVVKKGKWSLKQGDFVILLSGRTKNISKIQRGHPCKIILQWPEAQPHLNTLLSEAFSLITKNKMVDCWAIEKVAVVRSRDIERKKWRREKFGELGEIIGELIPKKYISVTTQTTTTKVTRIRDNVSGVVLEKTETSETQESHDGRVLDVKTWLEISRLARDEEANDIGGESELEETARADSTDSADAARDGNPVESDGGAGNIEVSA